MTTPKTSRPATDAPSWATDSTYAHPGQSWDGASNKVPPSAGETAQGYEPSQRLPAPELNYHLATINRWLDYLDGISAKVATTWLAPTTFPWGNSAAPLRNASQICWDAHNYKLVGMTSDGSFANMVESTDGGQNWTTNAVIHVADASGAPSGIVTDNNTAGTKLCNPAGKLYFLNATDTVATALTVTGDVRDIIWSPCGGVFNAAEFLTPGYKIHKVTTAGVDSTTTLSTIAGLGSSSPRFVATPSFTAFYALDTTVGKKIHCWTTTDGATWTDRNTVFAFSGTNTDFDVVWTGEFVVLITQEGVVISADGYTSTATSSLPSISSAAGGIEPCTAAALNSTVLVAGRAVSPAAGTIWVLYLSLDNGNTWTVHPNPLVVGTDDNLCMCVLDGRFGWLVSTSSNAKLFRGLGL